MGATVVSPSIGYRVTIEQKGRLDEGTIDYPDFDAAAIVTMKEVTEYLYNTERQGKVWIDDELKKAIDEYYSLYGAK